MNSNDYRSNSVAASARSNKSRTTLVDNDPSFITNNKLRSGDTYKAIIHNPPRNIWVDHLLAMFCVKLSSSTLSTIRKEYVKPETVKGSEVC
jgi:hypothetical protein